MPWIAKREVTALLQLVKMHKNYDKRNVFINRFYGDIKIKIAPSVHISHIPSHIHLTLSAAATNA
jgi:hypothetical protein